jgi:hypothetical protein
VKNNKKGEKIPKILRQWICMAAILCVSLYMVCWPVFHQRPPFVRVSGKMEFIETPFLILISGFFIPTC